MRIPLCILAAALSVSLSGCVVLPKPPPKSPSVIMPQANPEPSPSTVQKPSSDCWDGSEFDKDGLCPPEPVLTE